MIWFSDHTQDKNTKDERAYQSLCQLTIIISTGDCALKFIGYLLSNKNPAIMIRKKTAVILSLTTALFIALVSSCNFGPPENSRAAQAVKGQEHFKKYCVQCHGEDGKGLEIEGLERRPSDLTILTKLSSSGEFPIMSVARAIDGRNMPDYHKESGMPIWGEVFATDENMNEKQMKGRFAELIAYLMAIQGT